MGYTTFFRKVVLVMACLGLILQTPMIMAANTAQAAQKPAPVAAKTAPVKAAPAKTVVANAVKNHQKKPLILDIGLHPGSTLVGQVINEQGIPQAKQSVSLIQKKKVLVTGVTDKNGYFSFTKVPAGTYNVVSPKAQGLCRVWAPKTAPPIAQPGILLVDGKGAVRAQEGPIAYWLGKPWVIAGLVAAAVAIPVAIHNHQNDKSPVSPY
ncbi:MAG: carboxypeptidase-like regulatory domain-containing protein [Planctomycetia bacterium]|jgi:hypothetical protein